MSTRTVRRRRRRSVTLLFAVLGGLFLMHGLSSHGAVHHSGSADVAMVHAAETATVHSDAVVRAGLPAVEAPAHGGGHAAQFAELCMAILAGGLLLALLTRRSGITAVARVRRTHRTAGALAFAGRPPDPPDLRKLSVCRC